MTIDIQPVLENDKVVLYPLSQDDFEDVYSVASDPDVWRRHPNKDRWRKEVFQTFFEGAMQSKGAFKIVDKTTGDVMGSTRFYDYDEEEDSILIGYTFFATRYWGIGMNQMVKTMMLDYIFRFVSQVYFHIGADHVQSQKSIVKLGVRKIGEQEITYFGEQPKMNYVYGLTKREWSAHRAATL